MMRFISLSVALLSLTQHVFALPVEGDEASALDVTLSQVKDTRIKAVVKNTGSEDVTFLHLNFFRDSAPVKKVAVYQNGPVPVPTEMLCNADSWHRGRSCLRRHPTSHSAPGTHP